MTDVAQDGESAVEGVAVVLPAWLADAIRPFGYTYYVEPDPTRTRYLLGQVSAVMHAAAPYGGTDG